jgi:hypothetical protein
VHCGFEEPVAAFAVGFGLIHERNGPYRQQPIPIRVGRQRHDWRRHGNQTTAQQIQQCRQAANKAGVRLPTHR